MNENTTEQTTTDTTSEENDATATGRNDTDTVTTSTDPTAATTTTGNAQGDEPDTEKERDKSLAAEAARYRHAMREAKEEAQTAQARNEELQQTVRDTQHIAALMIAREKLRNPDDLDVFLPFDKLLDENGQLDENTVRSRIDQLLAERPYLARQMTVMPFMRPRLPKGTPLPKQTKAKPSNGFTASQKLGDGDVSWHELLDPQGDYSGPHKGEYRGTLGK